MTVATVSSKGQITLPRQFREMLQTKLMPTSSFAILNYKGISNDNRSILIEGLRLFQEKNADIVDALVHTISKENN